MARADALYIYFMRIWCGQTRCIYILCGYGAGRRAVYILCGYGGIGRRAGFRFLWATVQVQLLLSAPKRRAIAKAIALLFGIST